jgi:hypothetical protein
MQSSRRRSLARVRKSEAKRALVKRLIPIGEMESAVADKNEEDADKKYIGEQIDEKFEKDDIIKGVIGEMQPPVIRRREELAVQTASRRHQARARNALVRRSDKP